METQKITFSFGKNWSDFLENVSEDDIARAMQDLEHWLGRDKIEGKRVVDIGSGSGIHSLSFSRLGAASVHSFDYDPRSVEATRTLHRKAASPQNWTIEQGSVLDEDYLKSLGSFDIVYSWGVLHHTGAMWSAIANALGLAAPHGVVWISLYEKGPRYPKDLALKKKFNAASPLGKRWMIFRWIIRKMLILLWQGKNPLGWNYKVARGMNVYHDIVDWLGGLPYEAAAEDDVVTFARKHGFQLERIKVAPEGGCSKYVFSLAGSDEGGQSSPHSRKGEVSDVSDV